MNRQTEWNNRLLTLQDQAFFNLMRNYIGNLETPFNKHRMIEKLNLFMGKDSNLKRIANGLDELDKKILTIIFLLDGTPEAPVIDLLQELWSSWEVRQRLINLQERLLLFKGKHSLYYPTPQTEEYLRDKIVTPENLFPASRRNEGKDSSPWLNDGFLNAFLSVLIHRPPGLKNDGTLNRKSLNDLQNTFPCFKHSNELPLYLLRVLTSSGLIKENSSRQYEPEFFQWKKIADHLPVIRLTTLWAEFLTFSETLSFPWKQEDGEKIVTGLIKSMPEDCLYQQDIVLRILSLLLTERRPPINDLKIILERLIDLGILIKENDGLGICRDLKRGNTETLNRGIMTLHPNHELTIMPDVELKRIFPLAWYLSIQSFDQVGIYILDQASFFRGLHKGKELPAFQDVLEDLSSIAIPQNIEFSLKSWQEQFRSVRLIEGIILKVDQSRIPLIENNPFLKPYIREVLAPGLYLMDPGEKDQWEPSLLNTGITALPPVEKISQLQVELSSVYRHLEEGAEIKLGGYIDGEDETEIQNDTVTSSGEEELIDSLEKLKLPPGEMEELEERIRKKVILLPSQLKKGIVQKDMREAKGLDYNGKIRLIETALSSGHEYLEISWFTPEDDLQTDKIIPRHLSKEDEDLILSGPYLADPGGTDFRIRVRKISHIKRKKLSFFGL
ncbi:MAG: hypothetical protein JEY99_03295 [Spirochaetales bacterium]|nr:hypothetical protein [Spirochaetales bacterium]